MNVKQFKKVIKNYLILSDLMDVVRSQINNEITGYLQEYAETDDRIILIGVLRNLSGQDSYPYPSAIPQNGPFRNLQAMVENPARFFGDTNHNYGIARAIQQVLIEATRELELNTWQQIKLPLNCMPPPLGFPAPRPPFVVYENNDIKLTMGLFGGGRSYRRKFFQQFRKTTSSAAQGINTKFLKGIFEIFISIVSVGLAGLIYALIKLKKTLKNLFSRNKILRSIFRILGAGGGAYAGFIGGSIVGALLGSVIPGAGSAIGAIIGASLGIAFGAWAGIFITKHIAKLVSLLIYGDTNAEKWSLTTTKAIYLRNKGFNLNIVYQLILAIKKEKVNSKRHWLFSQPSLEQIDYNHLLAQIKNGTQDTFVLNGLLYDLKREDFSSALSSSIQLREDFNDSRISPSAAPLSYVARPYDEEMVLTENDDMSFSESDSVSAEERMDLYKLNQGISSDQLDSKVSKRASQF